MLCKGSVGQLGESPWLPIPMKGKGGEWEGGSHCAIWRQRREGEERRDDERSADERTAR
jgi:hypothetical protein